MKMFLAAGVYVLCLAVAVTGFDAYFETTRGFSAINSPQITWINELENGLAPGPCNKMGVLKLNFGAPGSPERKEKVLIDMWFDRPFRWVFHIGDSRTNTGAGRESETQSRDAEIQGTSSTIAIFGNDYSTPGGGLPLVRSGITRHRLSVIIGDGTVIWNNWGAEFNYVLNAETLFALNGQSDPQGGTPNYDIYFGVNRIIYPSEIRRTSRFGRGLCYAAIRWL